jgi:hypothetical protein
VPKDGFPFAITQSAFDVQLDADDEQTVVAGVPAGWSNLSAAAAIAAAPYVPVGRDLATQLQNSFDSTTHRYDQDPLVRALVNVQRNFAYTPPLGPLVYVELPDNMGGPREMDAGQIDAIIDEISSRYKYYIAAPARSQWVEAGDNYAAFYDQFSAQVDAYNKTIEGLRDIVNTLHKAKQQ